MHQTKLHGRRLSRDALGPRLQRDHAGPAPLGAVCDARGLLQVAGDQRVAKRVEERHAQALVARPHQVVQPRHACRTQNKGLLNNMGGRSIKQSRYSYCSWQLTSQSVKRCKGNAALPFM